MKKVVHFFLAAVIGVGLIVNFVFFFGEDAIEQRIQQMEAPAPTEVIAEMAKPTKTPVSTSTETIAPTETYTPEPTKTEAPTETLGPTDTDVPTKTPVPTETLRNTNTQRPSWTPPPPTKDYSAIYEAELDEFKKDRAALRKRKDLVMTWFGIAPGSVLAFFVALWLAYRIWRPELESEHEIDNAPDYVIAAPGEEDFVSIELKKNNQIIIYRHEVPRDVFADFCRAVIDGDSLGINSWTGDDKYFTRIEGIFQKAKLDRKNPRGYQPFLNFFFENGLLERETDSKHSQIFPTRAGRFYFEQMVRKYK